MKNKSVLPETAPEEPVSGPGINGNRKEKFTVKRTALAILLLLMAALCLTARAEITDHEAICDADGVTYYYLTAGHSPEHFGSVWYGGTELPPRQVILEGTLPEGLFLEWDEQEVRLAGTALKAGTGCFTVTVLYESPESGYGAIRSEYIYCVTEEPVRERLARSGYDFSVSWIPDTLSPGFYAGEDGYSVRLFQRDR